MSNNNRRSSLIDHHYNYSHSSSFSSSLLEEIYRSFDEDKHEDCNVVSYRKSSKMMNKSSSCYMERDNNKYEFVDRVRVNGKSNFRRNSMAEFNNSVENLINSSSSSTTSSSDSSSGIGGFSSSESESRYRSSKSMLKTTNLALKPLQTSFNPPEIHRKSYSDESPAKKKKSSHGSKEGNLQKRALKKLYGDLKKVKQPISPGGKLASFINSLFNSTASKKPKISSSSSSSSVMTSSSSYGEKFSISTPSTASSYARSCLSKTPSSARSVRFCPVNTVISTATSAAATASKNNNECYNVIRKGSDNDNEELKVKIMEKHRRVEEVAKELLKNYHQGRKYNHQNDVNMIKKSISNINDNRKIRRFEVEDEDEDDASCCSSDLFELENLLDVGVDPRYYREELPVYETTHVDTNRAIANGFIL